MPRLTTDRNIQIDRAHSRAICQEIGYRLRQTLENTAIEHPPHLQLLARLRHQDVVLIERGGSAPGE